MKKFIVEFLKRGAIFAGLGPLILAIVYFFLHLNGVVEMVPVTKMIAEIISSLILAFIACNGLDALPLGCHRIVYGNLCCHFRFDLADCLSVDQEQNQKNE